MSEPATKPIAIRPGGPSSRRMADLQLRRKICLGCGIRLDFWGKRPHADLCAPLNTHRQGCLYAGPDGHGEARL